MNLRIGICHIKWLLFKGGTPTVCNLQTTLSCYQYYVPTAHEYKSAGVLFNNYFFIHSAFIGFYAEGIKSLRQVSHIQHFCFIRC